MAELAASLIGIISAGTKVALVLSQLASDIGSAGQEARMISSEIRTFCTILSTLKDTMEKIEGSDYFAHCFDMMRGMTDASAEMFTEVLDAAETLRGMTIGKDGRDGKFNFLGKLQWVIFQKPKILVLRAAMEAYKSNIALMLGTINTVEKVARRTSTPQFLNTVNQDDQERTTLQSLELDCRSSLLSLEQAEHQYNEYMIQTSREPTSSPTEHLLIDTIMEPKLSVKDKQASDGDYQQERLIYMARADVKSMRSSLSLFSAKEGSLQAQIARHSQRLSKLMETDHQSLSQRWSNLPSSCADDLAETMLQGGVFHSALPRDTPDKHPWSEVISTTPKHPAVYVRFQTWLLEQPWSDQDNIVEALRAEVLSDRLDRHPYEGSQAALSHLEAYGADIESGEINISAEDVDKYFVESPHPPKPSISDTVSSQSSQKPNPTTRLPSLKALYHNASNKSQPTSAKTSRKEKRYSMLLANDASTPQAQFKSSVHGGLKEYMESMGASVPTLTEAELREQQRKEKLRHAYAW